VAGGPGPRVAEISSVVVIGTGAMACLFGARLARSGAAVTLVGTWPDALDALGSEGVRVDDGVASWRADVAVRRPGDGVEPADLVLVLVKSHRTAAIAPLAALARGPAGRILTLQNGLGNAEALATVAGAANVDAGVTTAGATLMGPAHVRPSSSGRTWLGWSPRAADVASLLAAAGFPAEIVMDLRPAVWRKLAANCAINALSALRGVPNGALLDSAADRALLEAAAGEAGAVAAALGIPLGVDPAAIAFDVARATRDNRSSMLQDLERGAPTEVDAINGAVVREGRRLRVPTPVNEALWRGVVERQRAAVPART
jgi:2-dehydropantoate 2-reductase